MFNHHRPHDRFNLADARPGDHRQHAHRGGRPRGPFDEGEGDLGGRPLFRGGPRNPRAKTGNLRLSILALLSEEARNGYSMIQELAGRSGGLWQPSPGSMYPALSQLEDEGLIAAQTLDGKKAYVLTEAGQTYVQAHAEDLKAPWDTGSADGRVGHIELRQGLQALMGAAMQVAREGNAAQLQQAQTVLKDARKALYRLLAEDDAASGS
ncbi:PadR family transcriptional regulator [Deinococcus sp.]|uniref:PadR family transcriptional regulator n=1 Tax=Deinococcus sp. TaxID=47478 RepID=UPI003CC52C67